MGKMGGEYYSGGSKSLRTIEDYLDKNGHSLKDSLIKGEIDPRMMVSVVIPAYNEERVISKTLEALNAQVFNNFEVIIVDNFSTDKTSLIVRDFQKKANYPLYVISEEKPGIAYARKRGMDEVLLRLVRRGFNLDYIIAVTDADVILPNNWTEKIAKGFQDGRIGGLAGTHAAKEKIDQEIEERIGINNYFNLIPLLIEFLMENNMGIIKMSGPNSAFSSRAYALGDGMKQEYRKEGKIKLNEVDSLGRRIRRVGYVIAPMGCRVIANKRRQLYEIINNGEDSYFSKDYLQGERLYVIRDEEARLLNVACENVPKDVWIKYRYKTIYKVLRNFIFLPLKSGEITTQDIQSLFAKDEIKFFLCSLYKLQFNRMAFNIFGRFMNRIESMLRN